MEIGVEETALILLNCKETAMKKIDFNEGWICNEKQVLIPHDAMIHEKRDPKSTGGSAHGYFPGGKYVYKKNFEVSQEMLDMHMEIEFEGVYRNSEVLVNGSTVVTHKYGYTPYCVNLDGKIKTGLNEIIVNVDNSEMPNSRWYSGSGIYRPVHLYVSDSTHIAYHGIKIDTVSINPAKIKVVTEITGSYDLVELEIINKSGEVVAKADGVEAEIAIENALLWDAKHPNLYECHVKVLKEGAVVDEDCQQFGIREISYSTKGLFVNGQRTYLQGGCIHHDNGILGAATWDKAERRRVRILKENGFNAIRMSHNPASDALVRACDEYGMYLMDETFDMWYIRKSKYDYALDFKECWKDDVAAMINRDYSHPSVIMYSIGNEVSEPGKPEGVELGKEIINFIKGIDPSRIVTGGMNMMIMGNYAKGKGQYDHVVEDAKKNETAKLDDGEPKNASLAFNIMASFVGSGMNKAGNSKKVDEITSPILDSLDVAGYNYGSGRYPLDGTEHPNRIVLGSETFPQDIYKNWEMVKKYDYLLGDFMWTSWDYLGEAGLGAWSYSGGMSFNRPYPWLLGGAGVIDILGNPDISCRNAQIVWNEIQNPVIGVRPVNHPGVRVSKSVWRGTNAIESWSWRNCDGNKTIVEVHTLETVAELLINNKSMGKKKTNGGEAQFKIKYQPGEVTAITYDNNGKETGRSMLKSADSKVSVKLLPEETNINAGDIVYIPVIIVDDEGNVECNADTKISITAEGGKLLGFGSANPCTEENYDEGSFTTYYGRALAVVYGANPGNIIVTAKSELGESSCRIKVN